MKYSNCVYYLHLIVFLAVITIIPINAYRGNMGIMSLPVCTVYVSVHMGDAENKRGWVCVQACTGVCLNPNVFLFLDQSSSKLPARPNKDKWAKVSEVGGGAL